MRLDRSSYTIVRYSGLKDKAVAAVVILAASSLLLDARIAFDNDDGVLLL
jgi:hypothetical protein